MKTFERIHIILMSAVVLCCTMASCVSELETAFSDDNWVERSTVSIGVSISGMNIRTRAVDLDATEWNKVKDIYVAIYNANNGERIGYKLDEQNYSGTHTSTNLQTITLENIKISGLEQYYIVGVANSKRAYGIYVKDGDDTPELIQDGTKFDCNKEYRLSDLLECADTWEKYRRISSSIDPMYVDAAQFKENVVMAGAYISNEGSGNKHLIAGTPQKVSINKPNGDGVATIEGGGFIHLERLVSHFDVNLIAGEGVTLNPTSWQVFNVPAAAFLQERENIASIDNVAGSEEQYYKQTPNAADIIKYTHQGNDGKIYAKSLEGRFGNANADGSYSFDFFQYENKHTGLSTCEKYADREKEYKQGSSGKNTGIYKSLCQTENDVYNNKAGFFVIKTDIRCIKNGQPYWGTAEYTIHLGYINEDSKDFNCDRNTKYTYNIKVTDIDNIIVEAKAERGENENQPGAEGDIVTMKDAKNYVDLDAHYGVFNITFTKEEMTKTAILHWRITCPYGDDIVILEGKFDKEGPKDENKSVYNNSQFYNWVQFVPLTEDRVQPYPSGGKEEKAINGMLYINDLTWNGEEDKAYTVFVDENVYEYAYDSNAASTGYTGAKFGPHNEYHKTWANYVNKNNRRLTIWFEDEDKSPDPNVYISSDGESIYTEHPALVISQKSIQTYYDTLDPTDTALGIEHYDEYSRDGTLATNRYYTHYNIFSTGNMNSDQNYTINGDARTWMYDVYNRENKGWNDFLQTELVNSGDLYGENGDYLYDDKGIHYYLNSCLARNRDLNGDGKIDADEIRWYMPQRSTFVRMFTGNIMLESPLYDYTKKWELGDVSENIPHGQAGSRYAMACGHQFYAYQAFSIGPINANAVTAPWQVRCIRDLGVSMAQTTNDNAKPYDYEIKNSGVYEANSVEKAYTVDTDKQIIDLSNYDRQALRATLDELKVNRVSERNSQPALKFQYSSSYCDDSNLSPEYKTDPHNKLELTNGYSRSFASDDPKAADFQESVNYNSVCKYYKEPNQEIDSQSDKEWRVPNISEAAILYDAGIINDTDFANTTDGVFSSTVWAVGYDWVSRVIPKSPNGNFVTVYPQSSSRTRVRCVRDID